MMWGTQINHCAVLEMFLELLELKSFKNKNWKWNYGMLVNWAASNFLLVVSNFSFVCCLSSLIFF